MSAVAYILVREGQVLVEERQEGKFKGQWLYPTEKLEKDEYHMDTLSRGLQEELGVFPVIAHYLGEIMNDWGYPAHVYTVMAWEGEVPDRILDGNNNRVEWKNVSEMTDSPHPAQRTMTNMLFEFMLSKFSIEKLSKA